MSVFLNPLQLSLRSGKHPTALMQQLKQLCKIAEVGKKKNLFEHPLQVSLKSDEGFT